LKGFNFKLENILKVKKLREDLEKAQLASLQNRYQEEENCLQNLQLTYKNHQAQLREKQNHLITIQELSLYGHYFNKTSDQINNQEKVLNNLEEELREQREKLLGKVRERKVLENLKQKEYQEYKKLVLHQEQGFLDEIATNNFTRPKG